MHNFCRALKEILRLYVGCILIFTEYADWTWVDSITPGAAIFQDIFPCFHAPVVTWELNGRLKHPLNLDECWLTCFLSSNSPFVPTTAGNCSLNQSQVIFPWTMCWLRSECLLRRLQVSGHSSSIGREKVILLVVWTELSPNESYAVRIGSSRWRTDEAKGLKQLSVSLFELSRSRFIRQTGKSLSID